jgi:hypothetical protein
VGIRRRGQRQARHVREGVHQRAQQAVVGAEIVAPFRNAVRLVDREQADRGLAQQFAEMRLAGAFGGDVEQVELAGAEGIDGLLRGRPRYRAGQAGGADAVGGALRS